MHYAQHVPNRGLAAMRVLMIHSKAHDNKWHPVEELELFEINSEDAKKNDVSLITKEAYAEAVNSVNEGFCHLRFKPNLVISMECDDAKARSLNQELDIGDDVKLFVLRKPHRCHNNCPLYAVRGIPCQWTKHIFYAGIRNGGLIRVGDRAAFKPLKFSHDAQTDTIV